MQLLALGLFAHTGRLSAAAALLAMGFGSSVAACGWVWLTRRSFRFDRARSSYFLLKNWALGRWILGCEATSALTANVMPWLIVFWLGPTATGIFATCDTILRFSNPIIISLTNVLTPNAAIGFSKAGKPALRRIVRRASALLSLFLFLFSVLLVIAGDWILKRSFGDAYAGYWPVLAVLGLNQLLDGLALGPSQGLVLLKRANIIFWAEVARFATSLVAAAVLIPRYGPLGAAFSLLIGIVPFSAWIVGAYFAVSRDDEGGNQVSISRASASSAPAGV
jgi:O-antigen/teichoic acid export membrane protein